MESYQNKIVSIVITTHDGVAYLKRAVDSVLNQDYPFIELIVVDDNGDGSDKQIKTEELLKNYIVQKKLVYIKHKENKRQSAAINTGLREAKGYYVGFLDDDDYYLDGKISNSVKAFENLDDDWGAVYTDVEIQHEDGRLFMIHANKSGNILYQVLLHTIFLNPSTMLMKKDAVVLVGGYDETCKRHTDYEFNSRFASSTKIKHIKYYGSRYIFTRRHTMPDQLVENRTAYIKKAMPIIRSFNIRKQKIIIAKNALDLCNLRLSSYNQCKRISSLWGYKIGFLSFIEAFFISSLAVVRYKMSEKRK